MANIVQALDASNTAPNIPNPHASSSKAKRGATDGGENAGVKATTNSPKAVVEEKRLRKYMELSYLG
jgi:hypothetical protein